MFWFIPCSVPSKRRMAVLEASVLRLLSDRSTRMPVSGNVGSYYLHLKFPYPGSKCSGRVNRRVQRALKDVIAHIDMGYPSGVPDLDIERS